MSEAQRRALTALRDVMSEHEIYFDAGYDDFEILSSNNHRPIAFFSGHKLFASDVDQLLQLESNINDLLDLEQETTE